MRNVLVAVLVGAVLAAAGECAVTRLRDEDACAALSHTPSRTEVERCVSSVVVSRGRMLDMVHLASNTTVLYPYTQILKDANATSYYYPAPVDLERELATLEYDVRAAAAADADDVPFFEFYSRLARVVASARDGHLDISLASPAGEPGFVVDYVGAVLPFTLALYGSHARIAASAVTNRSGLAYAATVERERDVDVAAIDGVAPAEWVARAAFAAFNPMKSAQGRFVFMHRALNTGLLLATVPDKDTLFSKHVVTYRDGTHMPFEFFFVNTRWQASAAAAGTAAREPELPFTTLRRPGEHGPLTEDEVVTMIERKARDHTPGSSSSAAPGAGAGASASPSASARIEAARRKMGGALGVGAAAATAKMAAAAGLPPRGGALGASTGTGSSGFEAYTSDGALYCRVVEGFADYVAVPTFSPDSVDEFLDVLLQCADAFDGNALPVVLDVPLNGGGYLALAAATFMVLSPYADARAMVAVREGAYTPAVVAQTGMGQDRASCADIASTREGAWYRDAVHVTYAGGTADVRSQTEYLAFEALRPVLQRHALTAHPRSQTELLVLTDGYCFSACSFLLNQLHETHSAVVVGYDRAPLGAPFEASQCASSVVAPADAVPALRRLAAATGMRLRSPFWQSFALDYTFRAVVPHDFLHTPVDTVVDYHTDDPHADAAQLVALLRGVLAQYNASCRAGFYRRSDCRDRAVLGREGQGVAECDAATHTWRTDACTLLYCNRGYFYNSTARQCLPDVCAVADDASGTGGRAAGSRSAGTAATLARTGATILVTILLGSAVTFLISVF